MALSRDEVEVLPNGLKQEAIPVRIVEPMACLIDWLPAIDDHELQIHTATIVNNICSSSLQRWLKINGLPYQISP